MKRPFRRYQHCWVWLGAVKVEGVIVDSYYNTTAGHGRTLREDWRLMIFVGEVYGSVTKYRERYLGDVELM